MEESKELAVLLGIQPVYIFIADCGEKDGYFKDIDEARNFLENFESVKDLTDKDIIEKFKLKEEFPDLKDPENFVELIELVCNVVNNPNNTYSKFCLETQNPKKELIEGLLKTLNTFSCESLNNKFKKQAKILEWQY